jgi:hypothetical protein
MPEPKTPEQILERIKADVADARYGYGSCDNAKYFRDMTFMLEQLNMARGMVPEQNTAVLRKELDRVNKALQEEVESHVKTMNLLATLQKKVIDQEAIIRAYHEAEEAGGGATLCNEGGYERDDDDIGHDLRKG